MQTHPVIDLKKPRIITIHDRGHDYTFTVAPISRKQWLKYFEGIQSTSENIGGRRVDAFDSTGARLALITEALVDVDGYTSPDGGGVTDINGWHELIPASHRIAVGNALIQVRRSEDADEHPIVLGHETVLLDAAWGINRPVMSWVKHLRHTFNSPSVEQQRRYNRDMSRSQVMGGSRTGKTRWLGAQATLAELYDELIVSVGGYVVDGEPLDDDTGLITATMDTYHKVAAAEALFTPAVASIDEEKVD